MYDHSSLLFVLNFSFCVCNLYYLRYVSLSLSLVVLSFLGLSLHPPQHVEIYLFNFVQSISSTVHSSLDFLPLPVLVPGFRPRHRLYKFLVVPSTHTHFTFILSSSFTPVCLLLPSIVYIKISSDIPKTENETHFVLRGPSQTCLLTILN